MSAFLTRLGRKDRDAALDALSERFVVDLLKDYTARRGVGPDDHEFFDSLLEGKDGADAALDLVCRFVPAHLSGRAPSWPKELGNLKGLADMFISDLARFWMDRHDEILSGASHKAYAKAAGKLLAIRPKSEDRVREDTSSTKSVAELVSLYKGTEPVRKG